VSVALPETINFLPKAQVRPSSPSCLPSLHLVLPEINRAQFKKELSDSIDKDYLINTVLADQQVLDFESYQKIMGLVSAFMTELSLEKNQETFNKRMSLLK